MTSTCLKRPLTLGLLALCGLSCGLDFVSVGVTVKNLTPDISSLYVYGQIDGRFETESNEFTQQLGHFTLQVPVAAIGAGQFTINAAGRANDRCKLSAGRVDTHISRDVAYREAEMNLVLLPSKLCTQLTTVTPALAPTEKPITLTLDGQNFAEGTTVTVAGVKATSIQVSSSTRLTATIPSISGAFGKVPVIVRTPDGQTTTRSDLLRYYAHQLSFLAMGLAVGKGPSSIAVGDINMDGFSDLAISNQGSNNISILIGSSAGSFTTTRTFVVGSNPLSVVLHDFNLDGKLDMATANFEMMGNTSVLLGDGLGGYGGSSAISVGLAPDAHTAGDFSGDGKPDLLVANSNSNDVSVLLGNGSGGFKLMGSTVAVGKYPIAIVSNDLNSDGALDVIVVNYLDNNLSVLLGTGTGAFGAATMLPVGIEPYSVVVGDFNADGKSDLAVANKGRMAGGNVSVLKGAGGVSFAAATSFLAGTGPRFLTAGDFNGDGRLDLAVANDGSNDVSVLLGDGGGRFGAATNFAVGSNPSCVVVGDFNQDGKPDLAVTNYSSNNITILTNTSR